MEASFREFRGEVGIPGGDKHNIVHPDAVGSVGLILAEGR